MNISVRSKFATKTKLKVGRAFSFNKTPSKLKRAVSTMMSPLSNHHQLTPSTDSTNLQLVPFSMLPVSKYLNDNKIKRNKWTN